MKNRRINRARRYRLQWLAVIMSSLTWLIGVIELAGLIRFGHVSPWLHNATLPETFEQWAVLAWVVILLIVFYSSED